MEDNHSLEEIKETEKTVYHKRPVSPVKRERKIPYISLWCNDGYMDFGCSVCGRSSGWMAGGEFPMGQWKQSGYLFNRGR